MASLNEVVFTQQLPSPRSVDFNLAGGSVLTRLKGLTYNFDSPVDAPFYQGKTVADRVILISQAYDIETPDGRGGYTKSTIPAAQIVLNTILVDVAQKHIIQRTQIQGRDGAVVEYIGLDDWELNFRGALVNHVNSDKPTEETKLLLKVLGARSVQVVSDYLNSVYNINTIVIDSKHFPTEEGISNTQYFDFVAFSEVPIELNRLKISASK